MGTKLTKESLKQMIKEELGRVLNEEKRKVYKPETPGPCSVPSGEPQCAGTYNNVRYEVCVPKIGWKVKKQLEERYGPRHGPKAGEIYLKKYCSYVRTSGKTSLEALKLARDETLKEFKGKRYKGKN